MAAKKTNIRNTQTTLPDYEPLNAEEIKATSESSDCCVCDNPNTTWCNPESPNGAASWGTAIGGFILSSIGAK